jgi:NADH:ubiquinone oxidoreductase subunit K
MTGNGAFLMANSLMSYLVISLLLLTFGIYGMLVRRNLIALLISIELILNGAALNFLAFNRFLAPETNHGEVFVVFIISLAAAEAAIGLSLMLALYRKFQTANIEKINKLKG